jgi:squalene-hopene/tetraprenyl-beta-curcumene cyclase
MQFSALIRTVVPAVSIIHSAAVEERRRVDGRHLPVVPEAKREARSGRSTRKLAELITSRQNLRGDWFYCTPYTILNLMALRAAGVPADDPAITRAHRFLRDSLYTDDQGGYVPSLMNSDIWDTSVATFSFLSMRGRTACDPHILPAIEFLLNNQGHDGGYGWGSGSLNDCDTDSTAAVLRALSTAVESATCQLETRIRSAMNGCREYLLSRQTRQGGFCVWAPSRIRVRPGPVGPVKGGLFDLPSADLTARILAALLHSGSTTSDPPIRRGLNYLIRMESPNGGWWCRWWAGYIPGTAFVLDALSAAGIRWNRSEGPHDQLTEELQSSMTRGARFLLDHQNVDGGWGETIRADMDVAWAARGQSRPVQTAAALYALLSCGYPASSPEMCRGFEWLLAAATRDGEWQDHQATFTILPGSLYYSHPMYSLTILPAALSAFLQATDG